MISYILISAIAMSAQAVPVGVAATPVVDKVRCEMVYEVYSRIPHKMCFTVSRWREMEKAAQGDINSSRNGRTTGLSGTVDSQGRVGAPRPPR